MDDLLKNLKKTNVEKKSGFERRILFEINEQDSMKQITPEKKRKSRRS